jgi:hypothetical protein
MKILDTIQRTITMKLIFGVLMTSFAFTAAANAQSTFSGTFVLTQEARWNHAVLPAGEYSIEMQSLAAPAVLHLKNSNMSFYTSAPVFGNVEKGGTHLNITAQGDQRRVRSLNLPGINRTLVFEPLTKSEREMIAKESTTTEVVAVVAARK